MSAGIIGRPRRPRGRDRGATPQSRRTGNPTPIRIVSATRVGPADDQVVVAFDQPVVLGGVPRYALSTGQLPTAARSDGPAAVVLDYPSGWVGGAVAITASFDDPAVSNDTGGRVNPGRVALADAAEQASQRPAATSDLKAA